MSTELIGDDLQTVQMATDCELTGARGCPRVDAAVDGNALWMCEKLVCWLCNSPVDLLLVASLNFTPGGHPPGGWPCVFWAFRALLGAYSDTPPGDSSKRVPGWWCTDGLKAMVAARSRGCTNVAGSDCASGRTTRDCSSRTHSSQSCPDAKSSPTGRQWVILEWVQRKNKQLCFGRKWRKFWDF